MRQSSYGTCIEASIKLSLYGRSRSSAAQWNKYHCAPSFEDALMRNKPIKYGKDAHSMCVVFPDWFLSSHPSGTPHRRNSKQNSHCSVGHLGRLPCYTPLPVEMCMRSWKTMEPMPIPASELATSSAWYSRTLRMSRGPSTNICMIEAISRTPKKIWVPTEIEFFRNDELLDPNRCQSKIGVQWCL